MKEFSGKVSVITGAGSGIGRALALELARRGARLALSDIDGDAVRRTAEACRGAGALEAESYQLDVSSREAVFAHADAIRARFGRVNLVINNAGVALHRTLLETPLEDYEWIVGINFWGVVYGTKAFLPDLIASGDGQLVNVSSLFGLIAVPENSGYGATKFAVCGFTESLRQEMLTAGHPVSVSCVHPGVVKTNIVCAARVPGGDAARRAELAESVERIAFTNPESAARTILRCIERDRPRILVGADARALDLMQRVLGSGYQHVVARAAAQASSAVSLGAPWAAGEIPTLLRFAWVGVAGAGREGAGVVAAAASLRRSAAALGRGGRPGIRR